MLTPRDNALHEGVFIGSRFRHGDGEALNLIDPSTGLQYASVSGASQADIDAAAEAAFSASRSWRNTSLKTRSASLQRIASLIESRSSELVSLQMRCNGKPRFEAEIDVSDAAATFRYYAQCCIDGTIANESEVALSDPAFKAQVRHEPVGVCALIVPWNFPMVTTAWKLAPALAAGCAVVIKPSELTPLAELALMRIVAEADVPPGVVNLVCGGRDTGAALIGHRRIAKVSFTGSTAAGKSVMRAASERMLRVSLELGGKSALIVFDDVDLDEAVELAFNGAFFNAGQMCSATSRVLVAASIHDAFVDRLTARASSAIIGGAQRDDAAIGPLISDAQRSRVLSLLARGQAEGAHFLTGGTEQDLTRAEGFLLAPTVCTNVATSNVLWREEIFGPVLSIRPFDSEDEAIELANDSDYGLVATVVSRDRTRGERVAAACEAGLVWINMPQLVFAQAAWGGVKQSGTGRELGPWGVRAFQEIKHVVQPV